MSAKDYVKQDCVSFGKSVGNLVAGVTGDGLGANDLDKAIKAVITGAQTVNEFKDVPAAAGLHTLGAASDTYGDVMLNKAIADEASEGGD